MLVLSREIAGQVVFPGLGISLEILNIGNRLVRVGVVAPKSITVLRGELLDRWSTAAVDDSCDEVTEHRLRNLANEFGLRIQVIEQYLQRGQFESAKTAWHELSQTMTQLRSEKKIEQSEPTKVESTAKAVNEPHLLRLLIVDDNDNERQLLRDLLVLSGFHVDCVTDGDEALRFLSTATLPHCVLLDINMPRVDGNRVLRSIRSDTRYRDVKIFGVTGEPTGDRHQVPNGLRGFDEWFSKPLDAADLVRALTRSEFGGIALNAASFSAEADDLEIIHEFC